MFIAKCIKRNFKVINFKKSLLAIKFFTIFWYRKFSQKICKKQNEEFLSLTHYLKKLKYPIRNQNTKII